MVNTKPPVDSFGNINLKELKYNLKMNFSIVILAGGKSSRMKSDKPKWMHNIFQKPILEWILETCYSLQPKNIYIIVSPENQHHLDFFDYPFITILQEEALGTGHAVKCFIRDVELKDDEKVMVVNGDVPFIRKDILKEMFNNFHGDSMILASILKEPYGYGRVIMIDNKFKEIIEQKDLSPLADSDLCNMGVYLFRYNILKRGLERLSDDNQSGEYYITSMFYGDVQVYHLDNKYIEFFKGVNTISELTLLETNMRNNQHPQFLQPQRLSTLL